jgi:hypothetical protein
LESLFVGGCVQAMCLFLFDRYAFSHYPVIQIILSSSPILRAKPRSTLGISRAFQKA